MFFNSILLFYSLFYSRLQFDGNSSFSPTVHKILFASLLLPVSYLKYALSSLALSICLIPVPHCKNDTISFILCSELQSTDSDQIRLINPRCKNHFMTFNYYILHTITFFFHSFCSVYILYFLQSSLILHALLLQSCQSYAFVHQSK